MTVEVVGGVPAGTVKGGWATPLTTATLLTVPRPLTVKLTVPPLGVPALPPPMSDLSVIVWAVVALKVSDDGVDERAVHREAGDGVVAGLAGGQHAGHEHAAVVA